jgi:hypothetical protein
MDGRNGNQTTGMTVEGLVEKYEDRDGIKEGIDGSWMTGVEVVGQRWME